MSKPSIKKSLFDEFSLTAKAAANPVRLEILDFLAQGECTVEYLAQKCGQKVGNISQHLTMLSQAGLVIPRRDGTFIHYRATEMAVKLVAGLAEVAAATSPRVQSIAENYFRARDEMCKKSNTEVLAALKRGEIVLLDVRPTDEFENGHIAGARSVPLADLMRQVSMLPANKEIVAYCRGPWCVLAVEAVQLLRQHGLKASRLADGYPQWSLQGLPVAHSGA